MKNFLRVLIALFTLMPSLLLAQSRMLTAYSTGTTGTSTDGLPATACSFAQVTHLSFDRNENLIVSEGQAFKVSKIDRSSTIVTRIAGNGTEGFSGDGGPAVLAQFGNTLYTVADTSNNYYILDVFNQRIRKVSGSTGIVSTIAGGGSSTSFGIAATSCALAMNASLCMDNAGNLLFFNRTQICKLNLSTNILDTVSYHSSGPIYPFTGGYIRSGIGVDSNNNIYIANSGVVQKIDTTGLLTHIGGVGDPITRPWQPKHLSDAKIATDVYFQTNNFWVDRAGNCYISDNPKVRKIDAITGTINGVAGYSQSDREYADYYGLHPGSPVFADSILIGFGPLCVRSDGTMFIWTPFVNLATLSSPVCSILDTCGVTNTWISSTTSIPATIGFGVHGTYKIPPSGIDSVRIHVNFSDSTFFDTVVASWRHISGTDTVYGFGDNTSWMGRHVYNFPGNYIIYYHISVFNAYSTEVCDTAIRIASNRVSTISNFQDSAVAAMTRYPYAFFTDTVISGPCENPVRVKTSVKGWVVGTTTSDDSVYIKFHYATFYGSIRRQNLDSIVVRKVPISPTLVYGYSGDSLHEFHYDEVFYYDTNRHWYADRSSHSFQYNNIIEIATNGGVPAFFNQVKNCDYRESHESILVTSGYLGIFMANNCTAPGTIVNIANLNYSLSSPACSFPYTAAITTRCLLLGSYVSSTSDSFKVSFGDGYDTSYRSYNIHTDSIGSYYFIDTLFHTYTIPGLYTPRISQVGGVTDTGYSLTSVNVTHGCTTISGTCFMDFAHDCTPDTSDMRLAYWPFAVVNNTRSDTTYVWAGSDGDYIVSLNVGESYSIYPNMYTFYGFRGSDSLHLVCPTSAVYTLVPTTGTTYNQNFGFECTATGTMDMSVRAWEWGAVPGDTGVVAISATNDWGYVCDTLNSTLTLHLDSRLHYAGMWSGPTPTTISGSTITWDFGTLGGVFDFEGNVKVICDTSATIFDTLANSVHVNPTSLRDPDTLNNTYAWRLPVRSSWDPNEKMVAPTGVSTPGYIPNGTELGYLIHFQNLGSAPARNVTVVDTIDADLQISTLQIVGSSAPVTIYQKPGHVIVFRFDNIYLPDSASDPAGSIGTVSFLILPKDGLAPGTQIKNKVGVYFDYNEPVYTNTTLNTIIDTFGITGGAEVCIGDTLHLHDNTLGGHWTITNSRATISSGGVVTGVSTGLDTVVYTVDGLAQFTKVISVIGTSVTLTGADSLCVGSTTTITSSDTSGTWGSSGSTATVSATGVVTGVSTGIDTVLYHFTSVCGAGTARHIIHILAAPTAGVVTGVDTICVGDSTSLSASGSGGHWVSSNPAVATVSASGRVTATGGGLVTMYYITSNICGSDTATHLIYIKTTYQCHLEVANHFAASGPMVFPNPTSGLLNVTWNNVASHVYNITITDAAGRKLISVDNSRNSSSHNLQVDLNWLANGLYLYTLETESGQQTGKILLER